MEQNHDITGEMKLIMYTVLAKALATTAYMTLSAGLVSRTSLQSMLTNGHLCLFSGDQTPHQHHTDVIADRQP